MSTPYYDQTLAPDKAEALLRKLGAQPARIAGKWAVYRITNQGEAAVQDVSGRKRVQLFHGACSC